MQQRHNMITTGQTFSLLFIARSVIMLTINTVLAGGWRMVDNLVSCAVVFLLNFVLIIPIWFLNKKNPNRNLLDHAFDISKYLGIFSAFLYAVYFILTDCYYLSFFEIFFVNVIDETLPLWIVAAVVLALAVYAAIRGIEAIARTAVFVVVAICAGILFIVVVLTPRIELINYEPLFYDGPKQTVTGIMLFLGRSTSFASLALILPQVQGRRKLGFTLWNVGVYGLMAVLLTIMVGALGNYANNQLFPVYTAAQVASAGVLENLDAIFTGVWISGLFIKVAFDLYLVWKCVTRAIHKKAGRYSVFIAAGIIGIVSIAIIQSHSLQSVFYGPHLLFIATAVVGFLIPLILIFVSAFRKRRRKNEG